MNSEKSGIPFEQNFRSLADGPPLGAQHTVLYAYEMSVKSTICYYTQL